MTARLRRPSVKGASGRRRSLRVALVGPVPPVASGVAIYNVHMADELASRVELDVLCPNAAGIPERKHGCGWRLMPAAALGDTLDPDAYDAIVYTIGNSHHHIETRALALRFPGVVWFHDARLTGLYRATAEQLQPENAREWFVMRLREQYGERFGEDLELAPVLEPDWWHRNGVFLSHELVERARGVIVNSSLAAQILRLDAGANGSLTPLLRLEHAVPDPGDPPQVPRAINPPLVATFGLVDWIKAPDRVLEAVARIAPRTGANALIVGDLEHVGREQLESCSARLGISGRVWLTGAVDDEQWWRLMRTATVAVQLRRGTHGEASGAIACAQAVGTPVITNIAGAADDYPADAVLPIGQELQSLELEEALLRLLHDRHEWQRYSAGALAHARQCTFAGIAERLIEFLKRVTTAPRASRQP